MVWGASLDVPCTSRGVSITQARKIFARSSRWRGTFFQRAARGGGGGSDSQRGCDISYFELLRPRRGFRESDNKKTVSRIFIAFRPSAAASASSGNPAIFKRTGRIRFSMFFAILDEDNRNHRKKSSCPNMTCKSIIFRLS